jgi:Fe-S-cluster containining protein
MMQFVPWRDIADWKCTACGHCCRLYSVVLNFPEWLRLVNTFGAESTVTAVDKLFIKRADDGCCAFLCRFGGTYYCRLQRMKPAACKLWPFKILSEPKYGQANQALFNYKGKSFFIYADTMCSGLRYGAPTWEFSFSTLKEFVELAIGTREVQSQTTSRFRFLPSAQTLRFRPIWRL